MATAKWTELPKFTDYLSTAATITSLVLALLAIIYAFISNDSLSQATGVVSEAANEAHEATTKISVLLSAVESLTNGSTKTNEHLSLILSDLKAQLSSLDATAETLGTQASAIAGVLPEIPRGLDALGRRLEEFAQATPTGEKKEGEQPVAEEIVNALAQLCVEQASAAGLILMHALNLSNQKNKSFDLKTFTSNFSTGDYMHGFFVALSSLDMIDYEKGEKNTTVTVTRCPPAFSEARNAFLRKVEKQTSSKTKQDWINVLSQVESAFQT